MRAHRIAVAVASLSLIVAPAAAHASPKRDRLSVHDAKRAVSLDVASRSFTAAVGAGPATVTHDPVTGLERVEYAATVADYSLGKCERLSPRRVWCPWNLWVVVESTREVVYRESGGSVARLARGDVTVADQQRDALRRPASAYASRSAR